MSESPITELALSRIWQSGHVSREMRTVDGKRLQVVYPGVWTHSDGPDFRDALIDLSGSLLRGSVELHVRAGDWLRHGHDANTAYDDVILHAVLDYDLDKPLEQPPGRVIPTVELRKYLSVDKLGTGTEMPELGALGQFTCLPTLAGGRVAEVRAVLRREGWKRLVEKQLRFSQEFERLAPAEVLYRGLLDGLGLARNRAGMAQVAERVPIQVLDSAIAEHGRAGAMALLLGAGGFLPLSPAEAQLSEVETTEAQRLSELFERLASVLDVTPVPAAIWDLHRVRPLNHPLRRLASMASLVTCAGPGGLLDACLNVSSADRNPWGLWIASVSPAIGTSRMMQLTANVLAPFAAAYAQAAGNAAFEDEVSALWERLPGRADDATARSTLKQIAGSQALPIHLAVEAQGLHHIGRHGCRLLRCFECPIAALAMTYERSGL